MRGGSERTDPVEVQLLAQVTEAGDWPEVRREWAQRNPCRVDDWPRHLAWSALALNLWPLAAGHFAFAPIVSDARRRQPISVLAEPGLIIFDANEPALSATTPLALACGAWIEQVGAKSFAALRIAPPILEYWANGGRLLSRTAISFGLNWPPASAHLPSACV
jgi:hypothetical protein